MSSHYVVFRDKQPKKVTLIQGSNRQKLSHIGEGPQGGMLGSKNGWCKGKTEGIGLGCMEGQKEASVPGVGGQRGACKEVRTGKQTGPGGLRGS